MGKIIFHIDANSAFLSWEAVNRLQHGDTLDIRNIPSIIGGDPETRHGIVLAKSIPAKKYGIQTGETLRDALLKCPGLYIASPNYSTYIKASNAMIEIFKEYSPTIQRYSVDEVFMDYTGMETLYGEPIHAAHIIKDRVHKELGFTVNVGVSSNKLLAKMASDFKKPDMVHTCFPVEIKEKLWILPIEDLFGIGRATAPKLHKIGIHTIGQLANCNIDILKYKLKSWGVQLWQYANGIDVSIVTPNGNYIKMKGLGNSTTIPFDVTDRKEAYMVLISLIETTAARLRDSGNLCSVVAVTIRNKEMISYSIQHKFSFLTDSTNIIIEIAKRLFDKLWHGEPIRHLGVRLSQLCPCEYRQISMFEMGNYEKQSKIDSAVDAVRIKYGSNSIIRSCFLHSGIRPINGGVGESDYPLMSSIL